MKNCPNKACVNHTDPPPRWFVKNGTFKPKLTQKKVPRYRCKACGKYFSTHTGSPLAYMKRPDIQLRLFGDMVSGVSMRRVSRLLNVQRKTVTKHFYYLAGQVKAIHLEFLKTVKTGFVEVDELETFMLARACTLSVPMVVQVKTRKILGFAIARMPSKGKLAKIGQTRYGWTKDERPAKFQKMIKDLLPCFRQKITFKCDSNVMYPKWIMNQFVNAKPPYQVKIDQVISPKKKTPTGEPKPFDELFAINNTFAKMRNDMNRLSRKTWNTTKLEKGLEAHLWLYLAWHNGYFVDPNTKKKSSGKLNTKIGLPKKLQMLPGGGG